MAVTKILSITRICEILWDHKVTTYFPVSIFCRTRIHCWVQYQRGDHGITPPFQLLPHHLRILSGPNSAYCSRVTTIDGKLSVALKLAIPCQGSNAGFAARCTCNGISGGRICRSVASRRGIRLLYWQGPPVKNMFYPYFMRNRLVLSGIHLHSPISPFLLQKIEKGCSVSLLQVLQSLPLPYLVWTTVHMLSIVRRWGVFECYLSWINIEYGWNKVKRHLQCSLPRKLVWKL